LPTILLVEGEGVLPRPLVILVSWPRPRPSCRPLSGTSRLGLLLLLRMVWWWLGEVVLKSQTRLVKDLGRVSFLLRFSGMFLDPAESKEVFPPELLESSVSYSC